jgi:hypothetical protein
MPQSNINTSALSHTTGNSLARRLLDEMYSDRGDLADYSDEQGNQPGSWIRATRTVSNAGTASPQDGDDEKDKGRAPRRDHPVNACMERPLNQSMWYNSMVGEAMVTRLPRAGNL